MLTLHDGEDSSPINKNGDMKVSRDSGGVFHAGFVYLRCQGYCKRS